MPSSANASAAPLRAVLISPYELGRQPFALAEPAAWLRREGVQVDCLDLSLQKLDRNLLAAAGLIALYVGMHTATRIAMEALPRIRAVAPQAHLCVYGLYAPMNEALFRSLGVHTLLGGEFEPGLREIAQQLASRGEAQQIQPMIDLRKVEFITPDRATLPPLSRYAHLNMPDGSRRTVGFVEASRGCKHWCRHCPIVPVYQGKFRIVPVETVLEDIRQQVHMGARHISFGDPDFLNGPTHALRILERMRQEFPGLTFDATIKIQHLLEQAALLPQLKSAGCLFLTTAVEAVDDRILEYLDKHHTRADFVRAAQLLQEVGIHMAPTFVPFTPWTTLEGYIDLLRTIADLNLVDQVPPVQLSIRLLVPEGSHLLNLPGFSGLIGAFDPKLLGYPWQHRDARVDQLQRDVQAYISAPGRDEQARRETFAWIWQTAHAAASEPAPPLQLAPPTRPAPYLSEPWYCCAEPTEQQLLNF